MIKILALLLLLPTLAWAGPEMLLMLTNGMGTVSAGGSVVDDFNRSDGALGSNWATMTGEVAPAISSNVALLGSANSGARYTGTTYTNDQFSEVKIGTTAARVGPIVRASASAETYYFFGYTADGTALQLYRRQAGTFTLCGTELTEQTRTNGDILKLTVIGTSGTNIKGYVNGVEKMSCSDNNITSGSPGFFGQSASATVDDFNAGNL